MTTQESEIQWQSLRQSFMQSWNRLRMDVRAHWERLTEEDIADIEGRLGRLRDKISERYGVAQNDAELQIREWVARDVPWLQQVRTVPSFRWTVISLVTAVVAAILGFTNLADLIRGIAQAVFWLALVAFVVFLVIHLSMRARRSGHAPGPERAGEAGVAGGREPQAGPGGMEAGRVQPGGMETGHVEPGRVEPHREPPERKEPF